MRGCPRPVAEAERLHQAANESDLPNLAGTHRSSACNDTISFPGAGSAVKNSFVPTDGLPDHSHTPPDLQLRPLASALSHLFSGVAVCREPTFRIQMLGRGRPGSRSSWLTRTDAVSQRALWLSVGSIVMSVSARDQPRTSPHRSLTLVT